MERLLQMLGVLAVLYAAYALSLKKWDYASEAKRTARRTWLKSQGLSNTFYFIHAGTLFLLNLLSGGLFTFYWIYRQWQAIVHGFRRLDAAPLKHGPLVRTLGGFITFFSLNAIICRTCEYMRHKAPLPPWVWGSLWLASLGGAIAGTDASWRLTGYIGFCAIPAFLQRRLNALPKNPIPPQPKPAEIIAATSALLIALALVLAVRMAF